MKNTDFLNSSRDYADNSIIVNFDGKMPSDNELADFIKKNYGALDFDVLSKELPSEYQGLKNPGSIMIKLKVE